MLRPLIITGIFYCCIFLLLSKNFISYLHPIILHLVIVLLWCHCGAWCHSGPGVTPVSLQCWCYSGVTLVLVLLRCHSGAGVTPVSLRCWCYSGVTPVLVLLRCHSGAGVTPVSLRCWCYSGVTLVLVLLRCHSGHGSRSHSVFQHNMKKINVHNRQLWIYVLLKQ